MSVVGAELGTLASSNVDDVAAVVFVDIAVVVVARLAGSLFRRFGQPAVVGEILGGIALGPSLLGAFPGNLTDRLFPVDARPFLGIIAQLGLVMFMFIVGIELDAQLVRGKERQAAIISVASVLLPFLCGAGAAAAIYSRHDMVDGTPVEFPAFALFIGASMSVTAFPVLARILTERGLHRTPLGALVLACAAVDDVLAWTLLAVVVAVVSSASAFDVPVVMAEALGFIAVVLVVVRPQLRRLLAVHRRRGEVTPDVMAIVLVGTLVCSYVTSIIGVHAIFGAFVFGVAMPREDGGVLIHDLLTRFEQLVVLLLLPVFFIVTGLSVDVRGLGVGDLPQLLLVIAVACFGKFTGATAAARALGVDARRAASVGVLMNTRGLTELVILTIGLELGVLDQELFTMLVIMAVVTTLMTTPMLRAIYPDRLVARDIAESEGMCEETVPRVVVKLNGDERTTVLLAIATGATAAERPAEVVLTRLLDQPDQAELTVGLRYDLSRMGTTLDQLRAVASTVDVEGVHVTARAQFAHDPAAPAHPAAGFHRREAGGRGRGRSASPRRSSTTPRAWSSRCWTRPPAPHQSSPQ